MLNAAGAASASRLSLQERREGLQKLMRLAGGVPAGVGTVDRHVPGPGGALPIRVSSPRGADHDAASAGILFFHGGGFVAGSVDTHHGLCCALAHESGARVISVDYRLAPEHKFPAAVHDGCAAAAWLLRHAAELGVDRERIAIAGDSAGATLAAVACRQVHGRDGKFAAQLLLCPITDFAEEAASRCELAEGYVVDRATVEHDLRLYLPDGHDRRDPRVSPLHAADLTGLPRTFVHTAEFDPMRDEGLAYAHRLAGSGVPVSHTCHAGMIHLFYGMTGVVPYARDALRAVGAQMRAALSRETVT